MHATCLNFSSVTLIQSNRNVLEKFSVHFCASHSIDLLSKARSSLCHSEFITIEVPSHLLIFYYSQPHVRPSLNLPHESSCSSFYKCFHGYAHLLSCPRDMIFDPISSACVAKDNTEVCWLSIPTPPTIPTTQFVPTMPTAPTLTTTSSTPSSPDEIPMPTGFPFPTAPTLTTTLFRRPTPPNINVFFEWIKWSFS